MTKATKTIFICLTTFTISAGVAAVAVVPHSSLAAESAEVRTSLRGHSSGASSTLVDANSSTGSDVIVDGLSIDLGFLINTTLPIDGGAEESKANSALEEEVTGLFKMAAMRKSMTKEAYDATPFGKSVAKISNLIKNTMMKQVTDAHKANQDKLYELAKGLGECGSTKNSGVAIADQKNAKYLKLSPAHAGCRAGEAGDYSIKVACWEEEADKKKVKELMCKTFDMVAKNLGDEQSQRQIVKKGGSEATETYIGRVTATVCGAQWSAKPKPQACGQQCKYMKAKDDCEKATKDWQKHEKTCRINDKTYLGKKNSCDSLQDQMDETSCKRAVEMKDACESYAECFLDRKAAFTTLQKLVKREETDRKAEWRGLKRMKCLIDAFQGGKVTNSEIDECKKKTHDTDHLTIDYPKLPPMDKCEVPHHYPNTAAYKADNFAPLPALAKGKVDAFECTGLVEISTTPADGSPKTCKCDRVTLNGPYSAGPMVACKNCLDVRRSLDKNSCPEGTKLFSPRTRSDWKTFLSSTQPLRAPNMIIDITRPQNGCGGCTRNAMNSGNARQRSWQTRDGSAWWLRGGRYGEPNGDYHANCYLDVWKRPIANENAVTFNDHNCNVHSKSYYCQAMEVNLTPKEGSPEACRCKMVTLTGKYSAGDLLKCTNCLKVSKSLQKNSCPVGTKIFSPRTREDWKTFIASAGPLRSPSWIIDVTQANNGCGGCTKANMNSRSPSQATWRTSDGTPWFLRASKYSEPNGDYKANCYLSVRSASSEDSVTFNDASCNAKSDAYYCQTAKTKKKAVVPNLVASDPEEAPAASVPAAPLPESGGVYKGFKCAKGAYTGKHSKCGNFKGVSAEDCVKKCQDNASAGDKKKCDKKTGLPDCVASVFDKASQTCILYRQCAHLKEWEGHSDIVTTIKASYDPAAKRFKKLIDMTCAGDAYTSPDGKKRGIKDTTAKECKSACFDNKWTGSRSVPVALCAGSVFNKKTGYCDFFEECEETEEKKGLITFQKIGVEASDNDDDDDEEEEDDDE